MCYIPTLFLSLSLSFLHTHTYKHKHTHLRKIGKQRQEAWCVAWRALSLSLSLALSLSLSHTHLQKIGKQRLGDNVWHDDDVWHDALSLFVYFFLSPPLPLSLFVCFSLSLSLPPSLIHTPAKDRQAVTGRRADVWHDEFSLAQPSAVIFVVPFPRNPFCLCAWLCLNMYIYIRHIFEICHSISAHSVLHTCVRM